MMSNSRIPSPARSLGVSTPRRYKQRKSRSVCSPGRSETSVKLTAMVTDFVASPLPNRRSVLNDDTEIIDMPKRKSWWRKLDENSQDVMEVFEHKDVPETNNIEENFDVEILSQEKKDYTLDLPESSDGESISSIVIPQRKLFTQKENHPPKKFPRVFNNREELVKLQKSHVDHENEIDVRPKSLFNQAKKPKTKPIFPSALLNLSTNKSIANKTREIPTVEPNVRNLFGNRPGTKRKNMFADFLVSESEDEVPEIQARVFGFQRKSEQKRRVSARGVENSPTTSILDVDIDDWKQLPSSTMMENQIEDLAATPSSKRTRLSRFIEPQETVSTNKELNKTKRNESLRSHKSKLSSSPPNVDEMEVDTSKTQKSKSFNKTLTDAQSSKLSKTYDADNPTKDIQNITSKGKNLDDGKVREHKNINASKNTDNNEDNQEPIQGESDGENDFTLEYENDEDNLEQVENNMNKIEENIHKNPPEEIQSNEENKSFAHNLSVQAKIPKDINKSKNKSNTSLVKATDINVTQNSKVQSQHDNSHAGFVNNEINKTMESGVKNKTIETIVKNESVKEKYVVTVKNNTINSEGQVNKIMVNSSSHSKSLITQNDNNDESITNKNKSINQVIKSSLSSDACKHDNEKSEESTKDNDDDEEMQNEDTSEESIQLDESETRNEGQEEEDGKNESNNEINETEEHKSEKAISLNAKELEQVIDEVDNIRENVDNLNKTDKNTEKSKINETKVDPPEAILCQQSKNFIESFTSKDEGKSPRKTKSMLKNNLRPSLAPLRESTGFSDNTANSSGANSGWDSHRTTRKTLRKTFGKDFTPRKSLRTLVMEKSAKQRQTFNPDLQDISKHPRANSTELPGHGMNEPQEELDDETIENIQHALESNVVVKETPEGTQNDIADNDHMETEETVNKTQERSKAAESHMQTEESDNDNAENSNDGNENSDAEASDHENDATENQQIEESNHANDSSNKEVEEESDHANDTSNNEQSEVESDHENDATENPRTEESDHANDTSLKEVEEEESDHANDTSNNEQSEVESDHENDATENPRTEESDHANDTSLKEVEEESDHANDTSNNEQSEVESDHENDATENPRTEESDHANDTSLKEVEEESDHANDTSDNEQTEEESDNENDATENPQTEESNHANDTSNKEIEEESDNEQTEVESDHENDPSNNQIDDDIDHANNTSNQHTDDEESGHANNTSDQENDHNVSMNEDAENQEVENSDQEQSDNDTRDNRVDESDYNEISENKENTEMEQTVEESNHFSKSMKQRTLDMYLEKINKQDLERKNKLREDLMNSLKTNTHNFKVPAIPLRRTIKPIQKKAKVAQKAMEVDDLPDEIKLDLKYKPPRRYKPKNASWATMRLYKYLETKLEPKYDYMARVRAEKFVNTLHEFVRHVKRHELAPEHLVTALKQEMARLKIVDTHYEFYHFFFEFMPREIRVKVIPDIVNKIPLHQNVFSNIIRS